VTCDESIRAIEAMLDGEIQGDERFELEAHLAGCESCRREVEERRAFSDRLGRSLHEALGSAAPKARPVVRPPGRVPWMRVAAVLLVGVLVGYAGTKSRLFQATPAEAREVANLLALKDGYESRERALNSNLETAARTLDGQVARAPEGAVRSVCAMSVANAAYGMAGSEPVDLPAEPEQRWRYVARMLSSQDWSERGQAVSALKRLSSDDVKHLKERAVLLNSANRDVVELMALLADPPKEPAIDVSVESQDRVVRLIQYSDGRIRVERAGAAPGAPEVYEAANVIEFRALHPIVATNLRLRGVDGDIMVGGVRQRSLAVAPRPSADLPMVVWGAPSAESGPTKAMAYQALVTDLVRSGVGSEDALRRAGEIVARMSAMEGAPSVAVRVDPAQVEIHLTIVRHWNQGRLLEERGRLQENLAEMQRRLAETERRLAYVRQAQAILVESEKR